MKKLTGLIVFIFCSSILSAQSYDLQLSTGTYTLLPNYNEVKNKKPARSEVFEGNYYRYIQFTSLPSNELKERLAADGIKLLMYLPDNTFIAAIKKGTVLTGASASSIRSIHPIKADYKYLKELKDAMDADIYPAHALKDGKVGIGFTYFETVKHEQVQAYLKSKGYKTSFEDQAAHWFVVWVKKSRIKSFAALPIVASLELVDEDAKPDNNVGRTNIRSNSIATDYSGGRKYNGQGVNIALQDDGVIGPHIDYQGRIPSQFLTNNFGDHGDHCGGTIMGAGNKDPLMRGMAWGSNLYVYTASNYQAFSQISTHYNTLGIRVISTSYSDGCNTGYTTRAQQLDMQCLTMPQLIHVFSAGNDGGSNCGYGAGSGWGNVTGGHKHSKNSIAVANLTSLDVRNSSSSRGPAHDGRLKPEVSAVGTNVMSTSDTNNYVSKTGTSMSCPAVAGAFAQLYHAYKTLNTNANPPSALIKAIVMNTADDLGNPGPDFSFGYGRVNALKAVQAIEQISYATGTVSNAGNSTHTIVVPAGVKRIKVMTYWHDFQAQIGAAVALVNNLNTTITDPSSTVHNPLVLNYAPNSTSLNANAVPGIDIRNNHEQITIVNPGAGNYVLTVNGAAVPMGPQTYYVTWLFEMDGFTITYPIGGEGFNPGETETIRWDAYETTGTQNLEYTTNNGTSWTTINAAIPGAQRFFNWSPPNIISGQCKVRISRGAFTAESDTNFSIIRPPFNLQVAWSCPDSVKLTWDQIPGATSYDVFQLGTAYMDSVKTVTTNSCILNNITLGQTYWFSARSRGALNAVSRRAIAVQKKPGVLNCPQVATDVACENVLNPSGTINDCTDLSKITVIVKLSNPGINTLSVIPVYYRVNNGAVVSETYQASLSTSTSVNYTFATKAILPGVGSYTFKAWATYAADPVSTNDTSRSKLVVFSNGIKTLPYSEDFETFSQCSTGNSCGVICGLTNGFANENNSTAEQIDWRTNAGSVPTSGTGPQADFTNGTPIGKYLYLESSSPCNTLTGHLLSPCFDLTTVDGPILQFAYHMYGSDMGTMHLDVLSGGVWTNSIWSMSGDKGDSWQVATVGLSAWANDTVTFRWRGITGSGSLSDMAIDGINLLSGTTGIDKVGANNLQLNVYPNPGSDVFNVVAGTAMHTGFSYVVSDITGRVVAEGKSANAFAKVNLQGFAAGVYTLKVVTATGSEQTKLYKTN